MDERYKDRETDGQTEFRKHTDQIVTSGSSVVLQMIS